MNLGKNEQYMFRQYLLLYAWYTKAHTIMNANKALVLYIYL